MIRNSNVVNCGMDVKKRLKTSESLSGWRWDLEVAMLCLLFQHEVNGTELLDKRGVWQTMESVSRRSRTGRLKSLRWHLAICPQIHGKLDKKKDCPEGVRKSGHDL